MAYAKNHHQAKRDGDDDNHFDLAAEHDAGAGLFIFLWSFSFDQWWGTFIDFVSCKISYWAPWAMLWVQPNQLLGDVAL
ncbi:hypothetical protein [Fructobacillus tropaeoli]|uniref:hypothetical protein n=1 Tax=Fructobacillus tropaeoli TaxID=709323 RepID=UPI0030C7AB69